MSGHREPVLDHTSAQSGSGKNLSANSSAASILRGMVVGQSNNSNSGRGPPPSRANTTNSLLSLSGSLLSSLHGVSTFSQLHADELSKRNKKHKHKDSSGRHSHKKRRHDTTIADSSAIALATAENSKRHKDRSHSHSHSHRLHSSSAREQFAHARLNTMSSVPGAGTTSSDAHPRAPPNHDFTIPSQFLYHPFAAAQGKPTGSMPVPLPYPNVNGFPVTGLSPQVDTAFSSEAPSSSMVPSGVSARHAAQVALFSDPDSGATNPPVSCPPSLSIPAPQQLQPHSHAMQFDHLNETHQDEDESPNAYLSMPSHFAAGSVTSKENYDYEPHESPSNDSSGLAPTATTSRICAQNTVSNIGVEDLRALFHMKLTDASRHLGMCTTLFKKICRKNFIVKWPYRKIHSLMMKVESLEMFLSDGSPSIPDHVKKSYIDQMKAMKEKIALIKQNATEPPGNISLVEKDTQSVASSKSSGSSSSHSLSELGDVASSADESHREGPEVRGITQLNSLENVLENVSHSNESLPSSYDPSKRRRYKTTYDLKTGWVANCSSCGKLGKYRHPSHGRVFQHSSGMGKYCGYFRDNPRKIEEGMDINDSREMGGSSLTEHETSEVSGCFARGVGTDASSSGLMQAHAVLL